MAIDHLLDEHEQSERARRWLRNNGAGLIVGVVLGLGVIGGWQWWQQHKAAQNAEAGRQYDAIVRTLAQNDLKKAKADAAALAGSGTEYAALAAMHIAKAQVDAGDRDGAIATLRAVQAKDPAVDIVVRARLARLLNDAGKPKDALALLGDKPEGAAAIETRGDALFALGRTDEARAAYALAMSKLDEATPQRRLVELKLIQVGGNPARPEVRG